MVNLDAYRADSRKHVRIPFVPQTMNSDCGAACLTMVLRAYGQHGTSLEDVRRVLGAVDRGTSASTLIDAAQSFGMRGRGVALDITEIQYLRPGAILYWGFNHYVVLQQVLRNGIDIVDPAQGHRRVPIAEMHKLFTGVAIEFAPTLAFMPSPPGKSRVWELARHILAESHLAGRIVATTAMLQIFGFALALLTGTLIDRVVARGDHDLLITLSLGLLVLTGLYFTTIYLRGILYLELRIQVEHHLASNFVHQLVDLPYVFFQRRSAGDIAMRINSNGILRDMLTSNTVSAALDGVLAAGYLVGAFIIQSFLGMTVLMLGMIRIGILLMVARQLHGRHSEILQTRAEAERYQLQLLEGIHSIKASGAETRVVERWVNLFVIYLNASFRGGRLLALVESADSVLTFASPPMLLLVGGYFVAKGDLGLGTMLAASTLGIGFLTSLRTLVSSAQKLQEARPYIERLEDVLLAEPEQKNPPPQGTPKLLGAITAEDLTFQYSLLSKPAVANVSLNIEAGQFVAIVGSTGAGKSTLLNLLSGFHRPDTGNVLYDGIDVWSMDVQLFRRQLGVVPQNPYLFGTSVRANITLSDSSLSMEDIIRAAKVALIHDEIMAMPMGYDTILADCGQSLSGGQRQRIALARALATSPAVLVLDEATSALDPITEAAFLKTFREMSNTRIIVSHNLQTIRNADVILVLEAGRMAQIGSHASLISSPGPYAELFTSELERS